jgi:hypothetical protein
MNRFNGSRADLEGLLMGGAAEPCAKLPKAGGTIDDGDACFTAGGSQAYMRHVTTAGEGGDLLWTHTTEDAAEANFGQWNLDLAEAGRYRIDVYTAGAFAQSQQARYTVHTTDGDHDFIIDQSHADGWQPLGEVDLAAGANQYVHLSDNTGEPLAGNVQLVFDAVRITRVDPSDPGTGSGSDGGDDTMDDSSKSGGCNAGGSAGWLLGLALVGLRRKR